MIARKRLKELVSYDPESGVMIWIVSRGLAKAGHAIGTSGPHTRGYIIAVLDGKRYLVHRLVWLYQKGRWPAHQIDHINGVRDDNRMSNLREATDKQNSHNRPSRGYYFHRGKGLWLARVHEGRKAVFCKWFKTEEEAQRAVAEYRAATRGEFNP